MLFNDGIDQSEPQSGPLTGVLGSEERLEQPIHDVLGDAGAFVFDDQIHGVFAGFTLDPHCAAGGRRVAGIGQQVDEHLCQALRIAVDPMVWVAQVIELYLEVTAIQRQQPNGILGHVCKAHGFVAALVTTRVGKAH